MKSFLINVTIQDLFAQFTKPTRDTFIKIFGEKGEEMFSINVKTSSAVTYPSDVMGRTLTFNINSCQLPENHAFYILLDTGDESHGIVQ